MVIKKEEMREILRDLIAYSCSFEVRPNKDFKKFHQVLLQFFTGAVEVQIDYKTQMISLWNTKPLTTDPLRLFDLNEAISDRIYYSNLEETLKGCIENGHLQDCVYKKILDEYGHYFLDNDHDDEGVKSA